MQENLEKYRINLESLYLEILFKRGIYPMKNLKIIKEIEKLRQEMIVYYLKEDMEGAVKISQQLDRKIYDYLISSEGSIANRQNT